jgi:hypothetical protein
VSVVRFYNNRGTAEQQIEEGKQDKMTASLVIVSASNIVRLALDVLAYNFGTTWATFGVGRRCPSESRPGR